ncbi:MAG: hypothetical protein AB7G47_03080 [Mycolicibacterium sp.]|uniref:hypothetical protein n=1 Tax=Mycolicibacterium sp. TaxID=2320850 RepID=UPI003D140BA6
MKPRRRHRMGALGGVLFTTSMVLAPAAPAESVKPVAGSHTPDATTDGLKSQGYDVIIQLVDGGPPPNASSMSDCVVTSINTTLEKSAYVSVDCPPSR